MGEAGFEELVAEGEELDAEVSEGLAGDAVGFVQEAEEEVGGGEEFLLREGGIDGGVLKGFFGAGGEGEVGSCGGCRNRLDKAENFRSDLVGGDALGLEGNGRQRGGVDQEGEEDVFGANEMVMEGAGLFCSVGEEGA